ncbi:hypothetical protein [Paenibacillus sp. MY03]|nr:hypothetical protein [Paenibacillus sp. MY03]
MNAEEPRRSNDRRGSSLWPDCMIAATIPINLVSSVKSSGQMPG